MARKRRPRRYVPHWVVVVLPVLGFRYDHDRHAYILRLVGGRRGPVIRDVHQRGRLVRVRRSVDEGDAASTAAAAAADDVPVAGGVGHEDEVRSHGSVGIDPPTGGVTAAPGSDATWAGNAPPRRRRRVWPWVLAGLVVGIVVWVGFVADSLLRAVQDSDSAQSAADTARAELTSAGAGVLSTQSVASLQEANRRIAALDSDLANPALTPLQILPWVGTQVRSARALATASNKASAAGVVALNQANAALAQPHGPGPGRVLLLQRLASIADGAHNALAGLDTGPSSGLIGALSHRQAQLASDISKAQDGLYRSAAASRGAASLLATPHQYLVLAANNAEMRAGQGIFLQGGVLTTGGGRMQLGPMQTVSTQALPPPGAPITPEFFARWGQLLPGVFYQNLGVNPQLDVTAPTAVPMWQGLASQHVDGVMVMDIEALQQVLKATGPVTTLDGMNVNADNVVPLLMHDQYTNVDEPGAQTARREELGSIARAAFDSANNGGSDLKALGSGLARAANGRHLMVWSADPHDQTLWQQADVAGQLRSQDLLAAVQNFGTNKLDYYLQSSNTLVTQPDQGSTDLTLTLHLHNGVPPGQSRYIAGPAIPIDLGPNPPTQPGPYGQYFGMASINLPASATAVSVDGYTPAQIATAGPEGPTKLVAVRVTLEPGQSKDVTYHFRMPGQHGRLRVVPSARIPAVSWSGQANFMDTTAHIVSW